MFTKHTLNAVTKLLHVKASYNMQNKIKAEPKVKVLKVAKKLP